MLPELQNPCSERNPCINKCKDIQQQRQRCILLGLNSSLQMKETPHSSRFCSSLYITRSYYPSVENFQRNSQSYKIKPYHLNLANRNSITALAKLIVLGPHSSVSQWHKLSQCPHWTILSHPSFLTGKLLFAYFATLKHLLTLTLPWPSCDRVSPSPQAMFPILIILGCRYDLACLFTLPSTL